MTTRSKRDKSMFVDALQTGRFIEDILTRRIVIGHVYATNYVQKYVIF